ncbi:MAG: hypothetical protein ACFFD4_07865 [Candidatus Odinarchaeota archaeon]
MPLGNRACPAPVRQVERSEGYDPYCDCSDEEYEQCKKDSELSYRITDKIIENFPILLKIVEREEIAAIIFDEIVEKKKK